MKIYFIGIGGIGVSALAQYYLTQGHEIIGADLSEGAMTPILKEKGAKIIIGEHRAENLDEDVDWLIYTNATPKDNPELLAAEKRGLKILSYPQALGQLTQKMYTIAVSGMHGKSTTTAMMALAAIEAGLDPTVIVGTRLAEFDGSNFRAGKSNYLIIEADEYRAALLNYQPDLAVVLNLEEEHLDFYRDLGHIMETFRQYLTQIKPGGTAILNRDDKNVMSLYRQDPAFTTYGLDDAKAKEVREVLPVAGEHNVSNALAVSKTLELLGVEEKTILAGLAKFKGTWRRMELRGKINSASIYDDYGHHPTEIKATLQAARELLSPSSRLWCVFQPHQYDRTWKLFEKFKTAFKEADEVLLLDIYSVPGRETEEIKQKVSSQKLVQAIGKKNIRYASSFEKAEEILRQELKEGDVCLIMGAGDIIKLSQKLLTD